jgi:exoribonuclease R
MSLPGILDLYKTYGEKNKRLYRCVPDDKTLPVHFIPYTLPVTFDKSVRYIYILFRSVDPPHGVLVHTLGRVESMVHTYEYLIHCKSLQVSIQPFTKSVIRQHRDIFTSLVFPLRTGHIFTIDSANTVDYDDAISVKDNIVSIYITNVPILLDHLSLWGHMKDKIATLYLPHKKMSMMPALFNELCSLKERTHRICLVMDLTYVDGVVQDAVVSLNKVLVSRNYSFDSNKLLHHPDYIHLNTLCKTTHPKELIQTLMVEFNTQCALVLKKERVGIYKKHTSHYEKIQPYHQDYTLNEDYCQTSSPIRRVVDVANMYLMCKSLYTFSPQADAFYKELSLETINLKMPLIRKLQYKCTLLSIFEKEQHRVFFGLVFDKTVQDENHYQVYLPDINVLYRYSTYDLLGASAYFKLIVLTDEAYLSRKLRLVIHTATDCS